MKPDRLRLISSLEVVTGAALLLFRAGLLALGLAPEIPPAGYVVFARASLVPEIILAAALIAAGVLLLKSRRLGVRLSQAACGALFFLGLLSISFNIVSGVYAASSVDLVLNGIVNVWCVGFGLFALLNLWKEE